MNSRWDRPEDWWRTGQDAPLTGLDVLACLGFPVLMLTLIACFLVFGPLALEGR